MGGGQIIGFSPVKVGQRSTKLVAELAILFAQAEKRTLVIDMHMDDPKIASLLGIKIEKGMEAWLTSDDPLREFIDFSAIRELAVLSLARKNPDYDELLSRRPLGAALIELLFGLGLHPHRFTVDPLRLESHARPALRTSAGAHSRLFEVDRGRHHPQRPPCKRSAMGCRGRGHSRRAAPHALINPPRGVSELA